MQHFSLLVFVKMVVISTLSISCVVIFAQFVMPQIVQIHQRKIDENLSKTKGFAFASYYQDHMVLQKAPQRAVIWGTYPDSGGRIILKVDGQVYNTRAKSAGVWSITLDPHPAGGPHTITAFSDLGKISIRDVLFGDVWVCSGQSNMQFTTAQIYNASKELNASSHYKHIRLFTVAMRAFPIPLSDLDAIAEPWSLPSATTLGHGNFTYFSAVCWLFGKGLYEKLGYPIGLIDTTWGGTPVEAWSSPDALSRCGLADQSVKMKVKNIWSSTSESGATEDEERIEIGNSELWNAMVHPLLNMTIYGAIWYQGEADQMEPACHHYNCTFPSMIDDWRLKFFAASAQTKPDFPFGFVQLAGNIPDMSVTGRFTAIRWHQTADYGYVPNPRMKNVFMAVSMDLPDFTSPYGSIHPRDKQDVAQRLLQSGLQVAYNIHTGPIEGPRPVGFKQQGNVVIVTYSASDSGDKIRLNSHEGFEFFCSFNGNDQFTGKNGWWLPSSIISHNATSVMLDGNVCGSDQFPLGIRYAWHMSPCPFKKCAIYSQSNDLPAPPFVALKPQRSGPVFSFNINWSRPQVIPPIILKGAATSAGGRNQTKTDSQERRN